MRGAFGKPQGTVARVHIGQIIMSVRAKDNHKEKVVEALRRAKFKYPGRQKVCTFMLYGKVIITPHCTIVTSSTSKVPPSVAWYAKLHSPHCCHIR